MWLPPLKKDSRSVKLTAGKLKSGPKLLRKEKISANSAKAEGDTAVASPL